MWEGVGERNESGEEEVNGQWTGEGARGESVLVFSGDTIVVSLPEPIVPQIGSTIASGVGLSPQDMPLRSPGSTISPHPPMRLFSHPVFRDDTSTSPRSRKVRGRGGGQWVPMHTAQFTIYTPVST